MKNKVCSQPNGPINLSENLSGPMSFFDALLFFLSCPLESQLAALELAHISWLLLRQLIKSPARTQTNLFIQQCSATLLISSRKSFSRFANGQHDNVLSSQILVCVHLAIPVSFNFCQDKLSVLQHFTQTSPQLNINCIACELYLPQNCRSSTLHIFFIYHFLTTTTLVYNDLLHISPLGLYQRKNCQLGPNGDKKK